jgi:hypothetical protein
MTAYSIARLVYIRFSFPYVSTTPLYPLIRALLSYLRQAESSCKQSCAMRMRNGIWGLAMFSGEAVPVFRRILQLPSSAVYEEIQDIKTGYSP